MTENHEDKLLLIRDILNDFLSLETYKKKLKNKYDSLILAEMFNIKNENF